jgi:hypothetical protein
MFFGYRLNLVVTKMYLAVFLLELGIVYSTLLRVKQVGGFANWRLVLMQLASLSLGWVKPIPFLWFFGSFIL